MSKIFKALERAETERQSGAVQAVQDLSLIGALDRKAGIKNPGHRQEYEKLKVMLTLAAARSDLKTIMLLSALSGEGVTTVTQGLAATLAEGAHQGVLVVDLSSSKIDLARRLGAVPRYGLTELLTKEASQREAIVASTIPRLYFLGRGCASVDFSQPHRLTLLTDLLTDLRSVFDYLVFDGGSLESSANTLLVASQVEGVVLVVQAEQTGRAVVREASDQLRKAGATLLGVVLNRCHQYIPHFISERL